MYVPYNRKYWPSWVDVVYTFAAVAMKHYMFVAYFYRIIVIKTLYCRTSVEGRALHTSVRCLFGTIIL